MGIGFGKDYGNAKKVTRIIIPDQQGNATTRTATPAGENQMADASLHHDETIIAWLHT